MEQFEQIRRDHTREGLSIRELANATAFIAVLSPGARLAILIPRLMKQNGVKISAVDPAKLTGTTVIFLVSGDKIYKAGSRLRQPQGKANVFVAREALGSLSFVVQGQ